jgi:arginine decarboxylase
MNKKLQEKTPLVTAMKKYVESSPTPFDVPGHKMGRIHTEFADLVGSKVYQYDVNAPIGIDNLYKGTGVIKEASDILADAFGADKAIMLINGTTSGIMMMVMGTLNTGDKIILPRNVHKSVINSLIVAGLIPVFIEPNYDQHLGIANAVPYEIYEEAILNNLDAKAVFVINPTYFGITCDLKRIVDCAHKHEMLVLCDEAHGAHFPFHEKLPLSAMEAGADVSAVSIHKTLGSLTQSSALLIKGTRAKYDQILKIYTMFGSTSPSYILLASIDAARKLVALQGHDILEGNLELASYARKKINAIPGISCFDQAYAKKDSEEFDFDETRLTIVIRDLGIDGFTCMHELKDKFNVQLELAEPYVILAILAIGSNKKDVDRLIEGLTAISKEYYGIKVNKTLPDFKFTYGDIVMRPRDAYYASCEAREIAKCAGEISTESVMIYPPGIPLLIPGEVITKEAVKIYQFYQTAHGAIMQDSAIGFISIVKKERKEGK